MLEAYHPLIKISSRQPRTSQSTALQWYNNSGDYGADMGYDPDF